MMVKPYIIGITGRAGAGKDTFAEAFIQELMTDNHHVVKYSFADPLKEAAKDLFGLSDGDVYTQEGKRLENPFWGNRLGRDYVTNRAILQTLGTEICRKHIHQDFWLYRAERFCSGVRGVIIIPDIRYANEADWVLQQGGRLFEIQNGNQLPVPSNKTWRTMLRLWHTVRCKPAPAWLHSSEDGLPRRIPRIIVRSMSADATRISAIAQATIFKAENGL